MDEKEYMEGKKIKFCILCLGRIGDLILTTSIIQPIRAKFPFAEFVFIVGTSNSVVVSSLPNTSVLILDKKPFSLLRFVFQLRRFNFDYFIDLKDHKSTESRIIAHLVRAKLKLGYNHCVWTIPAAKANEGLHFVERAKNALALIGITANLDTFRPHLFIGKEAENIVNDFLVSCNISRFSLINISASRAERIWDEEKWDKFINAHLDKQFVIISDHKDRETASRLSKPNVFCFPPSNFNVIMALVKRADIVLSPDTSIVHVASAFDKPVVALYQNIPSNTAKFAPLSTLQRVILTQDVSSPVTTIKVSDVNRYYDEICELIKY